MKILMVAPRYSPKSGGGFVVTNTLCKELVKRGHQVEVWSSDYQLDTEFVRKEYWDNPRLLPFPTTITLMGFHLTLGLCKYAKIALKEKDFVWEGKDGKRIAFKQFDAIHIQGCRTFQDTLVAYYARKYKIPYVVSANGFPIAGTLMHKLICWTFDLLFTNTVVEGASLCIAGTETGVKEYLRAGAKKENTTIIPCPYDLSIFDNLPPKGNFRKMYKIGAEKPVVGFLGMLDRNKGVDFLCQAFAKFSQEKDSILVLAGVDMGIKRQLEKLISKLGIGDKVIFTGYLGGRDKLEFLVDCDVCVFPSRAESGFPLVAVEATMCGVPVIVASGTGAAEDVSRIGCGQVVKFGDVEALNLAIGLALRDKIGVKNGQQYIRNNRSITERVKDYENIYELAGDKHGN